MIKKQGVKYLQLKIFQGVQKQEEFLNSEIEKLNFEGKKVIHIEINESSTALILYEQETI